MGGNRSFTGLEFYCVYCGLGEIRTRADLMDHQEECPEKIEDDIKKGKAKEKNHEM